MLNGCCVIELVSSTVTAIGRDRRHLPATGYSAWALLKSRAGATLIPSSKPWFSEVRKNRRTRVMGGVQAIIGSQSAHESLSRRREVEKSRIGVFVWLHTSPISYVGLVVVVEVSNGLQRRGRWLWQRFQPGHFRDAQLMRGELWVGEHDLPEPRPHMSLQHAGIDRNLAWRQSGLLPLLRIKRKPDSVKHILKGGLVLSGLKPDSPLVRTLSFPLLESKDG